MLAPPSWTPEQFAAEATTARENFRNERLREPAARWSEHFELYQARVARLFNEFGMANPAALTPQRLAAIFAAGLEREICYLAAPPISSDDLMVLADSSLAPKVLAVNPDQAARVKDTILVALDRHRLPWLAGDGREPHPGEIDAAVSATAALLARQRVQTARANEGKDAQEAAVKAFLVGMGFTEVATRQIRTLADAPAPGEFCSEALVGTRKADVPVRLFDGRLMPIECKVSNSSTNSVKRLNNDAAVKAQTWLKEFGTRQIVPAAVLSGVFKVHNLIQAQVLGLTIFWAHGLDTMRDFVEGTH